MSWNELWANAALCQKSSPDELFVRGAINGRGRKTNLECVAMDAGDFSTRCAWLNADGKADSAACARHAERCHGIPRNL